MTFNDCQAAYHSQTNVDPVFVLPDREIGWICERIERIAFNGARQQQAFALVSLHEVTAAALEIYSEDLSSYQNDVNLMKIIREMVKRGYTVKQIRSDHTKNLLEVGGWAK